MEIRGKFEKADVVCLLIGIGKSTNLAPMSYTSLANHDPPILTVGFAGGFDNAKDSLRNLMDTRECVINIISEHFIEAGMLEFLFLL